MSTFFLGTKYQFRCIKACRQLCLPPQCVNLRSHPPDPKQTLSSSFTEGSNLSLHEVTGNHFL